MTPTLQLQSGQFFELLNPENSVFSIEDIAHSLSNICRFTGHTKHFYSVAQHSVLASYLVPDHDRLAALLHDAPEAFIGDVARPLKRLLPDYAVIEKRVETAVLGRFGIAALPASVKRADMIMLATEKRDLMPSIAHDREHWGELLDLPATDLHIVPVGPNLAYVLFMRRYRELTAGAPA